MDHRIVREIYFLGTILALGCGVSELHAQYLVTSPNYTYTQDFGTSVISASGTNITSSTANLTGWMYDATLSTEINITAAAPTNTGGRYAYTLSGNSNRKIGARPSGGTSDIEYGILFRNTSGQTIQSFSVSYTGYQLSLGGNTAADVNKITVDYIVSTSSIAITAGGGTAIPALDFSQTQFVTTANTGGQGAGYPAAVGSGLNSGCVSVSASIPDNSYLLLRWKDPDDPQNDPHLAIDNVEVVFFTNQTVSNNTSCSLLPLELLNFYALGDVAEREIGWDVVGENNISAYIVERSDDGTTYNQLGVVGISRSEEPVKKYRFQDQHPAASLTYYRLSALETDGVRRFSRIVSLESSSYHWHCRSFCSGTELVSEFSGHVLPGTVLELYDLSGKQIGEMPVGNSREAFSLSGMAEGIYVLRVSAPDRSEHIKIAYTHP